MSEPIAPFLKYLPGFGIPKNTTPTSEEIAAQRRKAAREQWKKENNIVTANDIQDAEDAAKIAKAEKYAAFRDKEAAIRSEPRPILNQTLPPAAELLAYATPGVETLLMADDAAKSFRIAGEAIKHGQVLPAIGNTIRGVGEFGLGVASVAPVVGLGVGLWNKAVQTGKQAKPLMLSNQLNKNIKNTKLPQPDPSVGTIIDYTPLTSKENSGKTSLAFFERQPAKISEAERLGISKQQRHSIQRPSTAKYEAKLIGDNKIGVLDQDGNKIGYTQLRSKGNDLEVAYIGRNKEYALPEGEKFQEIGFEAARQYTSKLGKKLSTSDSFEHPQYQIPVIAEGFQTRPIKNKNRIHWNAAPTDANTDMAVRIQVVKDRLQQHNPFLTLDDLKYASDLSNLSRQTPIDSRGNSVPIYSLPELYDYKGNPAKSKWWQYIEEDPQSSVVYEELLNGYDVPGFYESWIGKPKRNFGVKFHFKSGGSIKIKKKNRGTFTRYCNGKVTEECIRKGKNSSNPTTRKRANFAWVARHKFKHEDGGKINYLDYFQK